EGDRLLYRPAGCKDASHQKIAQPADVMAAAANMVVDKRKAARVHATGVGAGAACASDAEHSSARDIGAFVKEDPLDSEMHARKIAVLDDERTVGSCTDGKGAATIHIVCQIRGGHELSYNRDVLMDEEVV